MFRGVKGGYSFARVAETISVLEVVELLDGPVGGVWPRAVRQRSRSKGAPATHQGVSVRGRWQR